MIKKHIKRISLCILIILFHALTYSSTYSRQSEDLLESWNDGPAKESIIGFVKKVTTEGPDLVVPSERIAVFDNDGTLWAEKPIYVQLAFAMDRVRAMAPKHPEWKHKQPFKAVLEDDFESLKAGGKQTLLELIMATHAGNTTEQFSQIVKDWIREARHPETGRLYTDMVYQPMLELLGYLRSNGFKTYIATGGGIEFLRSWAEDIYGIPPEQIIGSSIKTQFEYRDDMPSLIQLPEINFINDKAGKPVAINQHIGRRPIAAFGNSDGDLEMMQWVAAGEGNRFCLYVHHTDDKREWKYDRKSEIGKFDKGLDAAKENGWTVVSMKDDWEKIFPVNSTPDEAGIDSQKLIGSWIRPDGGYILNIRKARANGKLDAAYLNPNPINVSIAQFDINSDKMEVLVELRDRYYPGSYYTLTYDPKKDRLVGIYHHLGIGREIDVFFIRKNRIN